MGRRSADIRDPSHWVFNRLAADYLRRPPYPESLVARLFDLAGRAGARIADLGAGTGHLALPLVQMGARVTAVEPAREMLRALQARDPGGSVLCVNATAERTGLDSAGFDLALVADAIQWVDPELAGQEARRILRPGGCVAVVESKLGDNPFVEGLAKLLSGANPKAAPRPKGRARQFLSIAAGSRSSVERFSQEILLDGEALGAYLRSLTTVGPALGPSAFDSLLADAQALAREHGGALIEREIVLTWGRARAG